MAIERRKNALGEVVACRARVRDVAGNWLPSEWRKKEIEAEADESALLKLKSKGTKVLGSDAREVTFDEFWEVWSVENRTETSAGWKMSQNQMYRDYILPVIGKAFMADIGKPEVGHVLTRMKTMGRSAQLRKHVYALMRTMFGSAVEYYEMLSVNPVSSRFHRPKVSQAKRNFLAPADAMRLLAVAKDHYMGPAVWLEALSALRNSEAQALKWKAVQFDLGQILICGAFNKKTRTMQEYPKQGDWAYAPMTPLLAEYLFARVGQPDELVCKGIKGGVLPYETFTRGLVRLCVKAGVTPITPHELRHSCTEIFTQSGASTEDIRRLLNQASLTATKAYIHRTDDRLNRISGAVSGDLRVIQGGLGTNDSKRMYPNGYKETLCRSDEGQQNVR